MTGIERYPEACHGRKRFSLARRGVAVGVVQTCACHKWTIRNCEDVTDTDLDQSHALSRIFRTLGVKLLP